MKKIITAFSLLTLLSTGCTSAELELTDSHLSQREQHCNYTGDVLGDFPERTEHKLKGLGFNAETNTCKGYEDVSWSNYMTRYCTDHDIYYVTAGEGNLIVSEGFCDVNKTPDGNWTKLGEGFAKDMEDMLKENLKGCMEVPDIKIGCPADWDGVDIRTK